MSTPASWDEAVEVKRYEGFYKIGKDGTVFSLCKAGVPVYIRKPLIDQRSGYKELIFSKLGKQKIFYVHRLVAEAYIPNPENKRYVNHIDGNILNNNSSNLEWVTAKENYHHAVKTGLYWERKGSDCHFSKLIDEDVLDIRMFVEHKVNIKDIARMYNIRIQSVRNIINRKTWAHVIGGE